MTSSGRTYARAELAANTHLAWARTRVKFDRLPNAGVRVLVFRDAAARMISAVMVRPGGDLVLRDNVSTTNTAVDGVIRTGRWYTLTLRTKTDGRSLVWLDGIRLAALSADFGSGRVAEIEIGHSRSIRHKSYAVHFDSVAVDDTRLT